MVHTSVFTKEALQYLNVQPGRNYIDATADGGGHTLSLLKAVGPTGKVLAIEWDEELFELLRQRLKKECTPSSKNCVLQRASYTDIAHLVRSLKFSPVAGVLFDLGLSSFHLEASKRGFSFLRDEKLDMRMSRDLTMTAAELIKTITESELAATLRNFGGERWARRIAGSIVAMRSSHPIRRTFDLVAAVRRAVPAGYRRGPIHLATRTFQALRLAVNHELENIPKGLAAAAEILAPGGRIVAISFHSLEDHGVKHFFRHEPYRSGFRPLLSKPVRPSAAEVALNPRARSARLRAFEKLL